MNKHELLETLYTSRWYLNSIIGKLESNAEVNIASLKKSIKEGSKEINSLVETLETKIHIETDSPIIEGSIELWYPRATKANNITLKARGKYRKNYPVGAIVHYTAGRFERGKQSALDNLAFAKSEGLHYLVIAYDGTVFQAAPLNEWGYHAGESNWPNLGASVSNKLVGIEICNAGMLEKKGEKFMSWFGTEIPENDVREIKIKNDNQVKGYFHKYSEAQEESLISLLVWLKKNNPGIFKTDYILGHDEVAGPKGIGRSRKQDPGGALSMTMSRLRSIIENSANT